MSDETTRHLIDVNINANAINIPASVAIDFYGKVTADSFTVNSSWLNLFGDMEIGTWYQNGAALGIDIDGSGFDVNRPWLGQGDYDQMSTIKINNFIKTRQALPLTTGRLTTATSTYPPICLKQPPAKSVCNAKPTLTSTAAPPIAATSAFTAGETKNAAVSLRSTEKQLTRFKTVLPAMLVVPEAITAATDMKAPRMRGI